MARKQAYTRRVFLKRVGAACGTFGLLGLAACDEGSNGSIPGNPAEGPISKGYPGQYDGPEPQVVNCSAHANLSEQDKMIRQDQDYQDESPKQGKACHGCDRFEPPHEVRELQCGQCELIPGPISPGGWCKAWTEKTA